LEFVVSRVVDYRWHLRLRMAERGMFATTELGPLLAERGVKLSREQVYRLVAGIPERLSLHTLAALCDILDCKPSDIVEVIVEAKPAAKRAAVTKSAPKQKVRHKTHTRNARKGAGSKSTS
jgi:DNA-binding Xre family transcriptional regulator